MIKRPYSFLDEQDDVINDTLIIARDQDAHRDEVRENTWCLGMSSARAQTTPVADIVNFLQAVIRNRDQQLRQRYNANHPMLFYCWVDEMAGQLRFCLISGYQPRPPFGCELRFVETCESIAEQFLQLTTLDCIPWDQLHEVGPDDDIPEPPPYILDIWTQQLPLTL
jgi:hypothetical protein